MRTTPPSRGAFGPSVLGVRRRHLVEDGLVRRVAQRTDRLGVDRVAVYSFALVPWIRGHQKRIEPEDLPPPEDKLQLFALARETFLAAGFHALCDD